MSYLFSRILFLLRMLAFAAFLLIIFWYYSAHAHVFDVDFRTPEWDRVEQEVEEKEEHRSIERAFDGNGNDRDVQTTIDRMN